MKLLGSVYPFRQSAPWSTGKGNDVLLSNMMTIILTKPGERVNRPTFGCHLRNRLHDQMSPQLYAQMREDIISAVRTFEPRIRLLDLQLNIDRERSTVYIRIDWQPNDVVDEVMTLSFQLNTEDA